MMAPATCLTAVLLLAGSAFPFSLSQPVLPTAIRAYGSHSTRRLNYFSSRSFRPAGVAKAGVSKDGGGISGMKFESQEAGVPLDADEKRVRIVIVPHNKFSQGGAGTWYQSVQDSFPAGTVELMKGLPNPYETMTKRWERTWIDAMRSFTPDENTILVGHGSGAEAALRFVEDHPVLGLCLVATPGDEYYAGERHGRLYRWGSVKRNSKFIDLFHSLDDPMGKIEEARNVASKADGQLVILQDRGVFMTDIFPEMAVYIENKLNSKY
ncbi:hypothetical protein AAMO2058_000469000 [Amorphochlora amoebiformis]